jgi:RNA methyltransferase, TrmH family
MPITSPNNEQLKEVRKLAGRKWRDKTRTFVAEGEDLIAAATAAGWRPELLLCEAGSGLEGDEVAPHLLRQHSQLGSGTRALAVYPQRWAPAALGPVCVALWGVNDPGNVGTALRSALAFGAGSVALGPGTADPYGHKAVRASMGAIFGVPVVRVARVEELPGRRVALAARTGRPLSELRRGEAGEAPAGGEAPGRARRKPVARPPAETGKRSEADDEVTLVIGAERDGLPAEVTAACDEVVHIPIRSESLNAAMAATIALYEVTRVARA